MKPRIILSALLAATLCAVTVSPGRTQAPPATGTSNNLPWWGYCIIGTAAGPIWATLRLNKELKKDEAYVSMSWCGLGSLWLIYDQKYRKAR